MTFFIDKIVELSRIRRNRRRFCPFPSNNRRRGVTRKQKRMLHSILFLIFLSVRPGLVELVEKLALYDVDIVLVIRSDGQVIADVA